MDNIIDLLIILFFVFSAFGSLFKKKPESKRTANSTSKSKDPNRYASKSEKEYSKNPYDIFDFGQKEIPKEENLNVEIFEDELSKRFEHSKKSLEDLELKKNVVVENESVLLIKNAKQNKIIQMLRNKNSLKQAFILSEILGKPKALNRSGKNLYY